MLKVATRFGAALLAAAGLMSTQAIASAEPAGHQVRYTITTGQEATVNLYYLATEPETQAAYDANPNAYLRNERVTVAPGAPWVFETTLKDTSWAYVMAGGAARYNGTPNPHCDIAIDGNVVAQQDGETAATCALKAW
ncbi:hypothetical protein [Mycobacterium sp.]|jgi:hypothetical protein|uniref:hypothetical protein n=1 Tax=Mycobacterium sp. TaxID=1785 RepID=UPI002EDF6C49